MNISRAAVLSASTIFALLSTPVSAALTFSSLGSIEYQGYTSPGDFETFVTTGSRISPGYITGLISGVTLPNPSDNGAVFSLNLSGESAPAVSTTHGNLIYQDLGRLTGSFFLGDLLPPLPAGDQPYLSSTLTSGRIYATNGLTTTGVVMVLGISPAATGTFANAGSFLDIAFSTVSPSLSIQTLPYGFTGPIIPGCNFGDMTAACLFSRLNNFNGDLTVTVTSADPFAGVAPVPEPSSFALLLGGIGAMGLARRRRTPNL